MTTAPRVRRRRPSSAVRYRPCLNDRSICRRARGREPRLWTSGLSGHLALRRCVAADHSPEARGFLQSTAMETRRALVTGAASGIGAACAQRLAADGVQVVAVDYDAAGLEALEGVETVVADLADLDRLGDLPKDVDILVNNAGVQQVAPLEQFPPERFSYIVRLMLESPFRLIRQTLPHMYGAGWGRVINISSVHGLRASPFKAAYVAAKHGLEGLSKVVALEGAAHGVTSNCINPAYVRTPLVENQIAAQAKTRGIPE